MIHKTPAQRAYSLKFTTQIALLDASASAKSTINSMEIIVNIFDESTQTRSYSMCIYIHIYIYLLCILMHTFLLWRWSIKNVWLARVVSVSPNVIFATQQKLETWREWHHFHHISTNMCAVAYKPPSRVATLNTLDYMDVSVVVTTRSVIFIFHVYCQANKNAKNMALMRLCAVFETVFETASKSPVDRGGKWYKFLQSRRTFF